MHKKKADRIHHRTLYHIFRYDKRDGCKISQKFQLGGGSLYVYVPDENMEKLLKKVNIVLKRDTVAEFLTRLD